jgi:hypothetical protein
MTQVQLKDLFDRVVAGPEPTVDLDAWQAVREGRGLIRRRRLQAVVGAAAVALVVAAVPIGIALVHNDNATKVPVPPASQQVSPSQSPSPTEPLLQSPSSPVVVVPPSSVEPIAAPPQLVVLPTDGALTAQVTTWVKDVSGQSLVESDRCSCDSSVSVARAKVQSAAGQPLDAVEVDVSGPDTSAPQDPCPDLLKNWHGVTCTPSSYRGLDVYTTKTSASGNTVGQVFYEVDVVRSDGASAGASSQGTYDTTNGSAALTLSETRTLALRVADFYLFGGGENRLPRLIPPSPSRLAADVEPLIAPYGGDAWTIDHSQPPGEATIHTWSAAHGTLGVTVSDEGVLGDFCKQYLKEDPEASCTASTANGFDVFVVRTTPNPGTTKGDSYSVIVRRSDGAGVDVYSQSLAPANSARSGAPLTLQQTEELANTLAATYLQPRS